MIETEIQGSIEPLEDEWEQLAERLSAPPFARPGWISAWQGAFGRDELTLVTARKDGELAAVLPLLRRHGALRSTTNWHTPLFQPLTDGPEARRALLEAAVQTSPRLLDLGFVPSNDESLVTLGEIATRRGMAVESRIVQRSPWIALDGDWDGFIASLPSKRRSGLRRLRRRLCERGKLSIECSDGRDRLDPLLEEGFRVEASGWKGAGETAILSRPATSNLYIQVARWAAARGWLRLWFLRLDGRPLAFAYCLEQGGALYELKVGFEAAAARLGPGVVLTAARIEHAFCSGLDSYEFLGQPAKHKLDWTDRCRELARMQVFAPTMRGRISRLAWTHGRELALRLRR